MQDPLYQSQVLSALMFSSNWLGIIHLCSGLVSVSLMKHLFNSPEMYIWQHSYELPKSRYFEINFGLILAIWDYLFRTAYLPHGG
jgi:sterol desaturase/sphingolipid hydroxylase (fatty acid hydroxylase superfamily)